MKNLLYILLFVPLALFGQEDDPCYSVNDFMFLTEGENSSIIKNFVSGWNMFGYPCSESIDLSDAFSSIVEKVIMVKDNSGNVYMPEFGFNGIGFLEGGEGYQIKMTNTEYGFSFCEHITWPNLEGCTDCEAVNFNQWANVDDGSCNYDSDGDGIPDSEEIVGCQDSLACNYNILATDSGQCNYAEEFFNCDGTPQIGASYEGGIVFYIDDSGTRGLVAAQEDINGTYEWGCNGTLISDQPIEVLDIDQYPPLPLGDGLQNTLDIVAGCSQTPIAASEALAYEAEGYSDWYLPSKDELLEMYSAIGNGGTQGNIGGFGTSFYWSSTENSSVTAWVVTFDSGGTGLGDNKEYSFSVRPIRAFGNWTEGCLDSLACNYNPEANMADGSCTYADLGYDCDGNITEYVVGMEAEGGIVFYVDETGERGLVASVEDLYGEYQWGCYNVEVVGSDGAFNGADGILIGSGHQNTMDIVNQNCQTIYGDFSAAKAASNFEGFGYSDWFLPSTTELNELYLSSPFFSEHGLEFSFNNYYWSSTETHQMNAVSFSFENGSTLNALKDFYNIVRPVRAFGYTLGCMDETACNYNAEANMANGSCEFAEEGYDCDGYQITGNYLLTDSLFIYYLEQWWPELIINDSLNIDYASEIEFMHLSGNIVNIDGIQYFTNLQELTISGNHSLTSLPDLSGLTNLNELNISNNVALTSLSDLSGLTNLEKLWINDNYALTSLPDLSGLTNLNELNINDNDTLTSLPDLSGLTNLEKFWIHYNDALTSLPDLSGLTNLNELNISNNLALTSLPDLSGLTNLSILEIYDNYALTYLPELSELLNLNELYVGYNHVLTSIPDLSGLSNLSILVIQANPYLTTIGDLSGLTNLSYFVMEELPSLNSIPDLSGLTNLNELHIVLVSITSLPGLSELTNLEELYIYDNYDLECVGGYPEQLTIDESYPSPPVCEEEVTYQVGDLAHGGIVFYIDSAGQHGLVAALEDIGQLSWGCYGLSLPGADETSIGTGYQNTIDIVQGCSHSPIAASEALAYEEDGFSDWYLPSKDELFEMFLTIGNGGSQGNIGGFVNDLYWTSSDDSVYYSWFVDFENGSTNDQNKSYTYYVRPIRSF